MKTEEDRNNAFCQYQDYQRGKYRRAEARPDPGCHRTAVGHPGEKSQNHGPKTTVVVIEEVDTDNWGIDGQSVTLRRNQGL